MEIELLPDGTEFVRLISKEREYLYNQFANRAKDAKPPVLCLNPYIDKERKVAFKCGKCLICRYANMSKWRSRLYFESVTSEPDSVLFCTFTFNDDSLNYILDNNISWRSLHTPILKRFRRFLDYTYGAKARYWFAFELGSKTKRPHFHAVIFLNGIKVNNRIIYELERNWQYGFSKIESLRDSSRGMRYVAKYNVKQEFYEQDNLELGIDYPKPFSMKSKALGIKIIQWYLKHRILTDRVKINGKEWYLDRFLYNKLRLAILSPKEIQTEKERFLENLQHTMIYFCLAQIGSLVHSSEWSVHAYCAIRDASQGKADILRTRISSMRAKEVI
nr:replication initiation protein [Microvirus sp.]